MLRFGRLKASFSSRERSGFGEVSCPSCNCPSASGPGKWLLIPLALVILLEAPRVQSRPVRSCHFPQIPEHSDAFRQLRNRYVSRRLELQSRRAVFRLGRMGGVRVQKAGSSWEGPFCRLRRWGEDPGQSPHGAPRGMDPEGQTTGETLPALGVDSQSLKVVYFYL